MLSMYKHRGSGLLPHHCLPPSSSPPSCSRARWTFCCVSLVCSLGSAVALCPGTASFLHFLHDRRWAVRGASVVPRLVLCCGRCGDGGSWQVFCEVWTAALLCVGEEAQVEEDLESTQVQLLGSYIHLTDSLLAAGGCTAGVGGARVSSWCGSLSLPPPPHPCKQVLLQVSAHVCASDPLLHHPPLHLQQDLQSTSLTRRLPCHGC